MAAFAVVYLYILAVLFNYENAWMHYETAQITPAVLSQPSAPERFLQALNWGLLEGAYEGIPRSRPRILSHILEVANILFRNGLFHAVPPHPSLSLWIPVALFLSPYLLYRFLALLTADKFAGLAGALIYLCSAGNLIPVIMLFHPSKTMSNFFYILCLYLGLKAARAAEAGDGKHFRKEYIRLCLALFVSLFFDEYSLFLFVLIPVFYHRLFTGPAKGWATAGFLATAALFFLTVTAALPALYAAAGFPGFNVFTATDFDKGLPIFNPWITSVNFVLCLHDNLLAGLNAGLKNPDISVCITNFLSVRNTLDHPDNIRIGWDILLNRDPSLLQVLHNIFTMALLAAGGFALTRKTQTNASRAIPFYLFKSVAALVLYAAFFSYLHTTNNIISGCGWYASSFSALFAVMMALFLKMVRDRVPRGGILVALFSATLLVNSLGNVRDLNAAWMILNQIRNYNQVALWLGGVERSKLRQAYAYDLTLKHNNRTIVLKAWKARHDRLAVQLLLKEASAPKSVVSFLNAELPYIR